MRVTHWLLTRRRYFDFQSTSEETEAKHLRNDDGSRTRQKAVPSPRYPLPHPSFSARPPPRTLPSPSLARSTRPHCHMDSLSSSAAPLREAASSGRPPDLAPPASSLPPVSGRRHRPRSGFSARRPWGDRPLRSRPLWWKPGVFRDPAWHNRHQRLGVSSDEALS